MILSRTIRLFVLFLLALAGAPFVAAQEAPLRAFADAGCHYHYSVGVKHVFVNGVQALKDGEHTGAKPGRALWGPGKIK